MNDKELLELAAKAAGYVVEAFRDDGVWVYEKDAAKDECGEYPIFLWRPRVKDGDALRLTVKLGLDINQYTSTKEVAVRLWDNSGAIVCQHVERLGDDPYAATRRAIVRAAAEIGKEMK